MRTTLLLALAPFFLGCGGHGHDHEHAADGGHAHATEGPHGGHLLEVGDHVAHLEVLFDHDAGTLTIHVLGEDAETALPIAAPPVVKLSTASGPVMIESVAQNAVDGKSSEYLATGDALKADDLTGRVTVIVGGTTYHPDLEHDHDHEH